jgi:1-acyl-sn-glycerol-3-phosphate acyltransferase
MKTLLRGLLFGLARLLVGAHAHWQGTAPASRQRIYFANHGSHLDTILIVAALPPELRARTHPVAALDYWGTSKLRRYIAVDCLNSVLIDRSGKRGSDPLEPLAVLLESGQSLIIFPEGSRSQSGIVPFKSGLYHLASRFPDVELVPVYLENLYRVLPKGSMLLVPLICTVWFGVPVRLLPAEDRETFLRRAREAVAVLADGRAIGGSQVPRAA